jgi:hypothetical protein
MSRFFEQTVKIPANLSSTLAAVLSLSIAIFPIFAKAQEQAALLPLPQLNACGNRTHPLLPEKWRGVFLMAPFIRSQLVLAEIETDTTLPAMRVKLYGAKRGMLDLLVVGGKTFYLTSDGGVIKQCQDLGDTGWRPLPQDWLTPQSQCAAAAPVGGINADWWKTPVAPAPSGYWIWYDSMSRLPLRLVFQSPTQRLAVLGQFALSHQTRFEPLSQSNLAQLAATCEHAPRSNGVGSGALKNLLAFMSRSPYRTNAELKRLMPTFSGQCLNEPLPEWPNKVALTGIMTPFDSNETPLPTEVFYDWSIPSQRTRVFMPTGSKLTALDALLAGRQGYNIMHGAAGALCGRLLLPGTLRPDWPSRGDCSCEGTIEGDTPLTPNGAVRIMACPLASPRVAWAWYTLENRPITFMVTSRPGDQGAGLFAMLDYWEWRPGYSFPTSVFDKPAQCQAQELPSGPPHHCSTCHLGAASKHF